MCFHNSASIWEGSYDIPVIYLASQFQSNFSWETSHKNRPSESRSRTYQFSLEQNKKKLHSAVNSLCHLHAHDWRLERGRGAISGDHRARSLLDWLSVQSVVTFFRTEQNRTAILTHNRQRGQPCQVLQKIRISFVARRCRRVVSRMVVRHRRFSGVEWQLGNFFRGCGAIFLRKSDGFCDSWNTEIHYNKNRKIKK